MIQTILTSKSDRTTQPNLEHIIARIFLFIFAFLLFIILVLYEFSNLSYNRSLYSIFWKLSNLDFHLSALMSSPSKMPFTADAAAHQIQERLKNIYNLVYEIEEERNRSEHNLNNITKAHDKITPDDKVSPYYQQKLKSLYSAAVSDAQQEEELIRKALSKINEIRAIRNERRIQARNAGNKETIRRGALMKMLLSSAQTLPLYVGKSPGAKPPPLCGAIPAEVTYIAKMGDMVAALVKGSEEEENWILAEVVQYNPTANKYEVDDIDEEQKDRHVLSKRRVVPLPLMRANPETDAHALFPKGSIVMALYPQTTCFYKAVVNQLPTTATEEYEVLFEDATYADGYSPPLNVAQRYVISIKESKKNKSQS